MKPLIAPARLAILARVVPAAAALAILSACSVAPVQPPAPSVPLAAAFTQAGPAAAGAHALDGVWWDGYGGPTLARLVNEALAANQELAIALQRVAQARAGADGQGSRLWPTVGVQASASRSESGLPEPVKQGMPDTRALRVGVDVAWELDLAGGVRAARNAAHADAAGAAAGVEGARLLVASEVARQYFVLRGAEERLRIVHALAASQRETAVRVESRLREGHASAFDLDRARAEAEALDAQVPPLRTLAGVSQTRLAVLLGRNPSSRVVDENAGFVWPAAREIGTGQPSELLRRRPDLIAAEARVAAETLRSGEARAQWWPKHFLSALLGRQDLRLNALDLAPGLSTADIQGLVQTMLDGAPVTQIRHGEELIDVVVRATPEERKSIGQLGDLQVFTRSGVTVPLSQLDRVESGFEEPVLWRRNRDMVLTVRSDVVDGVQGPYARAQIRPSLQPIVDSLPAGYRIEDGGAIEESDKANTALFAVFPAMFAVMLTPLMIQLQSLSRLFMVFMTAPLALIGVVPALLLFQAPFGFVALLGVIALGGMIMRNSIILVDQIDQDIARGVAPWAAIVDATVRRSRPVVLTAAAAVLAMIPLTRSVFWGPMAISIMGGLVVATALTLVFVPALYAAWFRVRRDSPAPAPGAAPMTAVA
jgi:NodT family efflux transporter outer membrane factor (OMF) lipoprotein